MVEDRKSTIAVIMVSGIGGSNLIDPTEEDLAAPNKGFGADLTETILSKRMLSSADNVREVFLNSEKWRPWSKPGDDRGYSQVASRTYHRFMNHCASQGDLSFNPTVFAIGSNFIQSNRLSADQIILRTKEILKTHPEIDGYLYVTHSMGALTTRYALLRMGRGGHKIYKRCVGVIHVAAPQLGSPEVLKRFFTGVTGSDTLLSWLLGNTGERFSKVACVMPAICELLPLTFLRNERRSDEIDISIEQFVAGLKNILKDGCSYWEDNIKQLEQNLAAAQAFHQDLGNYTHPNTGAVVLTGIKTCTAIKIKGMGRCGPVLDYSYGDGSGILTTESQGAHVGYIEELEDVDHAEPLGDKAEKAYFQPLYGLMRVLFDQFVPPTSDIDGDTDDEMAFPEPELRSDSPVPEEKTPLLGKEEETG